MRRTIRAGIFLLVAVFAPAAEDTPQPSGAPTRDDEIEHLKSMLALQQLALLFVSDSHAQYRVLDAIAEKVIQKYQQSSCEQLLEKKGQPKSQEEREAVKILRNDPQRRAAFIDKVAAPIANKMFECGMIP